MSAALAAVVAIAVGVVEVTTVAGSEGWRAVAAAGTVAVINLVQSWVETARVPPPVVSISGLQLEWASVVRVEVLVEREGTAV